MNCTKTIGIIGAGQLGLMIADEAHALGARVLTLDPAADAPAFSHSDDHIVAAYDDSAALEELCRRSDVVTYEFENVPAATLVDLCARYNIKQGYAPLLDSQDRLHEKENARVNGLPVPRYHAVSSVDELRAATAELGYPCVLKTRRLGYDGHGQKVLHGEQDIAAAAEMLAVECILEEFVRFDYEVSVISVRSKTECVHFPVGRNIHTGGILDLSIVPAPMSDTLRRRITAASEEFMRCKGYEGILAIEYFVRGDEFMFNEMAPRPHNSGHYTIEGCTTNQFRELCRYLLNLPLEQPALNSATVMKNILGIDLAAAERIAAEQHPDVHVHLYGKSESRPLRKMGHITFTDTTAVQFAERWADEFAKR